MGIPRRTARHHSGRGRGSVVDRRGPTVMNKGCEQADRQKRVERRHRKGPPFIGFAILRTERSPPHGCPGAIDIPLAMALRFRLENQRSICASARIKGSINAAMISMKINVIYGEETSESMMAIPFIV